MARTESAMLALGTQVPDFNLPDVLTGEDVNVKSVAGFKGLLVMFICRHCPFVKHVERELAKLGQDYEGRGIGIVAISSNDAANYPEDAPESLAQQAREMNFPFAYLYDETISLRATPVMDLFLGLSSVHAHASRPESALSF